MSTSTKKDIVRGKRYTAEEKSKIVSFVESHNATNGRGGQSVAAKKFGVSQLTISSWLKGAGVAGRNSKASNKGSMQSKLASLLSLGQDISKLEKELSAKRAKFDSIKASL
jgi:transposase-like protein